jgi:hypothetical protein
VEALDDSDDGPMPLGDDTLRSVAAAKHRLVISAMISGGCVFPFALLISGELDAADGLLLAAFFLPHLICIAFAWRLGRRFYSRKALVPLALLAGMPMANMLSVMALDDRARAYLKQHGIRFGRFGQALFGPEQSDRHGRSFRPPLEPLMDDDLDDGPMPPLYDERPRRAAPGAAKTPEHLRLVAFYQRGLLVACAAYLASWWLAVATRAMDDLLGLVVFAAAAATAIFALLLGTRVYPLVVAVLVAFLALVPLANLLAVFLLVARAIDLLRANGVKAGILGADARDIPDGPPPGGDPFGDDAPGRR